MRIEQHQSVAAYSAEQWNRLGPGTGFTRHAWLSAVERFSLEPPELRILAVEEAGQLLGATILCRVEKTHSSFAMASKLVGSSPFRLATAGRFLVPHHVVGAPSGFGGHLLVDQDLESDRRTSVAAALVEAAYELGRTSGAPVWFSGVIESDETSIRALSDAGCIRANLLPLTEIPVTWKSFDEYVDQRRPVSKWVARNIRRERQRFLESGTEMVEVEPDGEIEDRLAELANRTLGKYGSERHPFRPGFYQAVQSADPRALRLCVARQDGEIVGFCTMIVDGDTAWSEACGFDYERAGNSFAYFNLVFYWPVLVAPDAGMRRIVFGRGQYDLRLRRGCRLRPTYVMRQPQGALGRFLLRQWLGKVDRQYTSQLGKAQETSSG